MRRQGTHERRALGGSVLLPPGPVGSPSNPPTTPLTILGSLDWWVRLDLGVGSSGGFIDSIADQSGNGVNFSGTGTARPALTATLLDGHPGAQFDGVDDILTATFSRVAPATAPFFMWFICRANTWTLNDHLWNDGGAALIQSPSTFGIRAFNGVSGTTINWGGASWFRVRAQFNASNNCIYRVGSATNTSATGSSASGATTALGASPAISSFGNVDFCEAFCKIGTPSAQNLTDLDTYGAARYPSAIFG